ncbi:hypothetical protein BDZ97DRAFT_1794494 [Flammula alnicola]|nr:hypothetical protein BDZ97DRAFT_1794494 [Flammula alnicola]
MYGQADDVRYPLPKKHQIRNNVHCPFCRLALFGGAEDVPDDGRGIFAEWIPKQGFNVGQNGTTVVFLKEDSAVSPYGIGRYIQPQIHPGLINKWISLCESHHNLACTPIPDIIATPERESGIKILRVIDVRDQCIVEAVSTLQLLRENKIQLTTKGGLLNFRRNLPRTVNDAIDLVYFMGERYLGLIASEMRDGISKMDLVYRGSILTILAGDGMDANAGLPGVHYGSRRMTQRIEEVQPGIRMSIIQAASDRLNHSRHIHRGWTNNNALLLSSGTNIPLVVENDPTPFKTYASLVMRYTARQLTKESDIINGMAGILRLMSLKLQCEMLEGLPTGAFDIGVFVSRRRGFPSWSWAGWHGTKTFMMCGEQVDERETASWLRTRTYILVWDSKVQQTTYGELKEGQVGYIPNPNSNDPYGHDHRILGTGGVLCGGLRLDDPQLLEGIQGPYEGVLMSKADSYDNFFNDRDDNAFSKLGGRPFYWLALIVWEGGVAERRALGFIYEECLEYMTPPGKVWKEIVLA